MQRYEKKLELNKKLSTNSKKNRIFVLMQKTILNIFGIIFLLGSIIIFEGCRKDPVFNTDPNFQLEFSTDTITFDTVFTSLGSTTAWLRVYNRSNQDVDIREIKLVDGDRSAFRMNVSGDTLPVQNNVRLRANDSLFIFITVMIDLGSESEPVLKEDFIRFSFNNRTQNVVLRASGQNAVYHISDTTVDMFCPISDTIRRFPVIFANTDTFLVSEKPHIIYGYLFVRSGETLVLNAGTRLYFAPNSGLIVADGGSLQVNGSFENEVIFEGMRLDANYRHITGQWDRIWLSPGSVENRINWAIIRNGTIGLLVDSMPNLNHPLIIENTVIDNMLTHGIYAKNAAIIGNNLQVSNCGERLLALIGGEYRFEHCTFANYFSASTIRRFASVLLDSTSLHSAIRADFTSCIIFGTLQEELEIRPSVTQHINFSFCNIRTRRNTNDRMFQDCIFNINPLFKNPSGVTGDFDISSETSGVIGKGKPGPTGSVRDDLKRRQREHIPTIGAYEYRAQRDI